MEEYTEYIRKNMRVKEICQERGITLKQLSEMVGFAAPQQMTNLVSGKSVSLRSLYRVAQVLDVEIGDLFVKGGGKVEERKERPKDGYRCPTCGARLSVKKQMEINGI